MSNLLVQNIKHTNNTTAATVDSSGGVAVAGTLAVTGVHTVGNNAVYTSDGGAVTQNMVQSLAKAWAIFTMASSFSTQNSFNSSGLTDRGTGDGRINFTNVFQDQHVCHSGISGSRHTGNGDANSAYINVVTLDSSHNFEDSGRTTGVAHGDLA